MILNQLEYIYIYTVQLLLVKLKLVSYSFVLEILSLSLHALRCMIREIMTIMIIQRGCSDVTRAEDGKLHSHLEWP